MIARPQTEFLANIINGNNNKPVKVSLIVPDAAGGMEPHELAVGTSLFIKRDEKQREDRDRFVRIESQETIKPMIGDRLVIDQPVMLVERKYLSPMP